ncbi:MAG: CotH kinase family protein [Clostridia bacterium]|nr:CotH kinase family protein [Clostridia bacterium]
MKKTLSFIICIVMMISMLSAFSFTSAADTVTDIPKLDYDALFEDAYIINGSWSDSDMKLGSFLTFSFRGEEITEVYSKSRHFNRFDTAYSYYLSQSPDILEDLPVFIFAPGTYPLVTVRYSAIILGANAGINPNSNAELTLDGIKNGVPANSARTKETIFAGGLTRTTRDSGNDAKWSHDLEVREEHSSKKANIKFIIDGIKLTGSVGISQYDYSNRLYTDLKLGGSTINYTPTGNRTTLTALLNSTVENFSGTGANALFSARCNSMNKNDVVMKNVRLTDIKDSAKFLFNKFFRNLTIDGMYFADSETSLFGTAELGSSFCGSNEAKTAEYDQNIEIKNSVFYKIDQPHTISLGNGSGGSGYTKMTANIHNNVFYDAVYCDENTEYWGIFIANSAKSGVDYTYNITDNVIHQQTTHLETLFNGNRNYQKSKTTINFNRNKVTGEIESIYPNTNWNSSNYNFIHSSIFYDFSENFHSYSPTDVGMRPVWAYPPTTTLPNGYDHTRAPYYLDYDLSVLSTDFDILSVSGLGSSVKITGYDVSADCSGMSVTVTPKITARAGTTVQLYKDAACKEPVNSIDLSKLEKGGCYFIKISKGARFTIGILTITTGRYSDINSISELDPSEFNLPVISVNTEGGAPIVDKENYVTCEVSITNTTEEYSLDSALAGIRYRGNSTLTAASKKPYRIKFDKKQNLFDMGKAKSWVLLANAFDKTMVRNALAFSIGEQVGLEYTSKFQFVNLYLNGKYQGLYLLCEQTQTGKTRVDVEEDETGKVDTGYLVEFTGNGDPDEDRSFTINTLPSNKLAPGVNVNWPSHIIGYLKTPELEFCTDAQVDYISDYVNEVNAAILTQNWQAFNELCDVESFAKYFVASTILNNGDGGYQVYMYKKENGGKLYAGPLWDFDQSSAATTQCGDSYDKWYTGSKHPWFDSFSCWPEFMVLAKSIYIENYDANLAIIDYYTSEFYPENAYDFHANDLRWDSVESDYWRITDTIKKLKSYNENFGHLANWFNNRIAWLDISYSSVKIPPSGITLSKKEIILEKNVTSTLKATVTPTYADDVTVSWQSSDPSVAKVVNGKVTALSDGKCTVTAKIDGAKLSASCTVLVCTNHKNTKMYNMAQHYNKCSICKKETGIENHKFSNVCDSTCDCGYTRYTEHKFGSYIYNKDATEQKDGTKTRTCSLCGTKETVTASGTKLQASLIDSSKMFSDVPEGAWYKQYVDYAVTHGIFAGTGDKTFSPNGNMTRAQFVQVFANLSGIDTSNKNVSSGFSDVPKGKWYTPAVTWAAKNGIVAGVGNGRFEPDAKVTREQMCVMLVNYIEKYQKKSLKTVTSAPKFTDDNNISSWAKTAVYKCAKAGLVNGVGNGRFDPSASANRAQGATIFTNFHKNYMK